SLGGADNIRAVNGGLVDSGFADGDALAAAVAGQRPFRGKASHLRMIAALFPEAIHLVVAANSDIRTMDDLRGKRVLLGQSNTSSLTRTRAILSAYRIRPREILSDETPATLLQDGKIDAYFAVAGLPLDSIRDLLARHQARLVPLDGEGRDRLLAAVPQLFPIVIPPGSYPGTPAIETVATRAWWFTRDSEPDSLIYGLTRALFNPVNRPGLAASHPAGRDITLDSAALNPPAPIHPGAARFYREAGKLH
ncbi:MAG TPA: TAXI family TRAP transporter solute-binding subunit, partial [Rhizomicrobium sp.]|nr:TAXI family TRAP transporter solute-binding subunit [Rhizomicrobium sp.]